MKNFIKTLIFGKPQSGINIINKQPKFRTTTPTERMDFNQWCNFIWRSY
jgi:hypothetical protein